MPCYFHRTIGQREASKISRDRRIVRTIKMFLMNGDKIQHFRLARESAGNFYQNSDTIIPKITFSDKISGFFAVYRNDKTL